MYASVSTTKLNKKRNSFKEETTSGRCNLKHNGLYPIRKSYSGSDISSGGTQNQLQKCRQLKSYSGINEACDLIVNLPIDGGCDCNNFLKPNCNCQRSQRMDASEVFEHQVMRNRSGSWTGVNESDDEIANMVHQNQRHQSYTPLLNDSMTASYPSQPLYASGYQNSHTSFENTVPHNHDYGTDVEKIRRRLKFFFMNPIEKWQAKKRFPWKLLVQIIKIVICTSQLCVFASQRYSHVTYLWDTKISFSHLFIQGWDSSREVTAYPPSSGPLALYKIKDFYSFLDYAIETFSTVEKTAIGDYSYCKEDENITMPEFCLSEYTNENIFSNSSWTDFITKKCITIPTDVFNKSKEWSTKEFLDSQDMEIDFGYLVDASFSFILKTFKILSSSSLTNECYRIEASIYFDNNDHDGQMMVEMDIGAEVLDCEGALNTETAVCHSSLQTFLNVSTITICVFSLAMCLRAILRAQILKYAVNGCFKLRFGRFLNCSEKFEFVNLWYVLICVNDILIVIGSIIKISLESQKHNFGSPKRLTLESDEFDYEGYLDKWNVCSLLLGTGNLFIWFGCLRYFGFFETYNVLILTLKSCFWNVLRYSCCIMMVFAGYSLCGWLVLGPYHFKFRSLSMTAECLYSLINGDDMFATFSSTMGKDLIVWWFSRVYLYTFCSLFIYVILSLFIAIIMDAYETIKTLCSLFIYVILSLSIAIIMDAYETIKGYYEKGFPISDLKRFANECEADPTTGDFHDGEHTVQDFINKLCCCCPGLRARRITSYERIPS